MYYRPQNGKKYFESKEMDEKLLKKSVSEVKFELTESQIKLFDYFLNNSSINPYIEEKDIQKRKELIEKLKSTHYISYDEIIDLSWFLCKETFVTENLLRKLNTPSIISEYIQTMIEKKSLNKDYFKIFNIIRYPNYEIVGMTEEELLRNLEEYKNKFNIMINHIINGCNLYKLNHDIKNYEEYSKICNEIIDEIDKNNYPLDNIRNACSYYINNFTIDNGYIIEIINQYNHYVKKQYSNEITKVDDFQNGEDFKFIVHNLTGEAPDKIENFRTPFVSASLITNNTFGLYAIGTDNSSENLYEVNRCGFILPSESIMAAKEKDLHVINRTNCKEALFYGGRKEAIISSGTIEEKCLKTAKDINSDQLSEDAKIYSEIVVDGFHPEGIFCITNGEGDLNYSYRKAKELAEKYDLPLKEIDQSRYRKKAGISPYTDYSKKILSLNVIGKIMPMTSSDYWNNMFIKEYLVSDICEDICEIFSKMKENVNYTSEELIETSAKIIESRINYLKDNPTVVNNNEGIFAQYTYFTNAYYNYQNILNLMLDEIEKYGQSRKKYMESKEEYNSISVSSQLLIEIEKIRNAKHYKQEDKDRLIEEVKTTNKTI